MAFGASSRGLANMKGLTAPSDKLLTRVVQVVYQDAFQLQFDHITAQRERQAQEVGAVVDHEPIQIPAVDFNYVIASSRTQPEIIYYMYDLQESRAVDVEAKILELRELMQKLAGIDAEIATIGRLRYFQVATNR